MAALILSVPEETARLLKELDVPEGTPENHSHITVAHLGKDVPIERIAALIPVLYDVTSRTVPFSVSTSRITTFPAGDDGVPVIAAVGSLELHEFRGALCRAMDVAGLEYSKKFPQYKPHVTITYADDPKAKCEIGFPAISWPCNELLLWGSNRGTGRLVIKFPLSLPGTKTATDAYKRACVQLSIWSQTDDKV